MKRNINQSSNHTMKIKVSNVNTPNWKDVNVKSHIPVELEKLSELARNIWWSWNYEATELFKEDRKSTRLNSSHSH